MQSLSTINWNGYLIEVAYQPNWPDMSTHAGEKWVHIEIRCLKPLKGPLPITGTGYRSHFTTETIVKEHGGPQSFVNAWLDHKSLSKEWKKLEAESRHGRLF
jgi:hypothetical protein